MGRLSETYRAGEGPVFRVVFRVVTSSPCRIRHGGGFMPPAPLVPSFVYRIAPVVNQCA
jgi:hypothetical protein